MLRVLHLLEIRRNDLKGPQLSRVKQDHGRRDDVRILLRRGGAGFTGPQAALALRAISANAAPAFSTLCITINGQNKWDNQ